ncbi:hypothetical protein [Glacieibacterium sp.]|uniref:hypothetical protein n=1 Tax=Glacieibacterium sp. TaxID=2860237 RepID=UPI003AFFF50D
MSDDFAETTHSRRWPLAVLVLMALVWVGIVAAVAVIGVQDYGRLANAPLQEVVLTVGSFVLQLLPPLAIATLAVALLRRTRPDEAARLAKLEIRHSASRDAAAALDKTLFNIDIGLDRLSVRMSALDDSARDIAARLSASTTELEASGGALTNSATAATRAGERLTAQLPAATAQADGLATLLGRTADETIRQTAEIETMLAGLWSAAEDAGTRHDSAVQRSQALLAGLGETATRTIAHVEDVDAALHGAVDGALERTGVAMAKARETVDSQTAALLANIDQAQVALDDIGAAASRAIGARLVHVLQIADGLGARLSEQDARSRMFVDTAERSFQVLDAKLGNAAAGTNAMLDALAARMQGVTDSVHVLSEPLASTHDAVLEIEAAVARLETAATAAVTSLGTDLPATSAGVADLEAGTTRLHDGIARLAAPVAEADAAAARISAALDSAHGLAEAVNTEAGSAALNASTQLIEVLARVREVANATAGTMRETLANVVAEAEEALRDAGSTRAKQAFGAPIQAEIADLEAAGVRASEAAHGAAERVAQRLLGLTRTVATVEARIDEVDTRYDVLLRDDISRRSEGLIASLNGVAIDVSKLLAIDVGDDAWAGYLKGDKGIFARRAVRLLDRNTARQVARHFQHDTPFREQAVRFITEFEMLLKRVMPDREGKALAVTLLSSDIGKLYVVLAQATEDLR